MILFLRLHFQGHRLQLTVKLAAEITRWLRLMIGSFFVRVLWNSRATRLSFFLIDMRKYLKNVARVFTWIEEGERLKDGKCSYQILYVLIISFIC